jgi:hypothetical protein
VGALLDRVLADNRLQEVSHPPQVLRFDAQVGRVEHVPPDLVIRAFILAPNESYLEGFDEPLLLVSTQPSWFAFVRSPWSGAGTMLRVILATLQVTPYSWPR